jgi:hypothetical protein
VNPFLAFAILFDIAGTGCLVAGILADGPARPGLIAMGISLLVAGSITLFFGLRLGPMGATRRLLRSGEPAHAAVRSMRDTGVTINGAPVIRFELEVLGDGPSPAAATVTQRVPRMLAGAVLPGTQVAVRLDPANPTRVAIDWSEVPRPATEDVTPADPVAALRATPPEERLRPRDILARGRRGRAEVVSTRTMGTLEELDLADMEHDSGDEMFLFELEVKLPGRDPYPATVIHRVPAALVGRVGPGREVPVAVDRDDPEHRMAIDWEEAAGEA